MTLFIVACVLTMSYGALNFLQKLRVMLSGIRALAPPSWRRSTLPDSGGEKYDPSGWAKHLGIWRTHSRLNIWLFTHQAQGRFRLYSANTMHVQKKPWCCHGTKSKKRNNLILFFLLLLVNAVIYPWEIRVQIYLNLWHNIISATSNKI